MIPNAGQKKALEMIQRLREYKGEPRIAVLAGFAGTGKTTLVKLVPEICGYPIVVAPTGKAALRVREATGLHASTIHSWMYSAYEDTATGEMKYSLKSPDLVETGEASFIVIDEASMVDEDLWEHIYEMCLMINRNILVVGDAFQLPPVKQNSEREFNLLHETFCYHERVLLTEVMRQALESPIIRASMLVRNGDSAGAIFALPRVPSAKLADEAAKVVQGGGVVICHKNDTRNRLNLAIRRALGRPDRGIEDGEPLLVLQNNYRLNRFNGEIVRKMSWVEEPMGLHKLRPRYGRDGATSRFGVLALDPRLDSDGQPVTDDYQFAAVAESQVYGEFKNVHAASIVDTARILYGGGVMPEDTEGMTPQEKQQALGYPVLQANFGYAMTAHKSQGSEWGQVLVVMEPSVRQDINGQRWLYTALTRARDGVRTCLGVPSSI